MIFFAKRLYFLRQWDAVLASIALAGMVLIPVIEVLLRPFQGSGIDNAPILVQHLDSSFHLLALSMLNGQGT
jgi:hypothetical protein